jgi:hypothetical protein
VTSKKFIEEIKKHKLGPGTFITWDHVPPKIQLPGYKRYGVSFNNDTDYKKFRALCTICNVEYEEKFSNVIYVYVKNTNDDIYAIPTTYAGYRDSFLEALC